MRKEIFHFLVVAALASPAAAQNGDHDKSMPASSQCAQTMAGMEGMNMGEAALSSVPSFHASSGTAWQPASVPQTMWMISPGGWQLMLHYNVFITYNQQGGPRGEGKAESTNYFMFMEQHRLGAGTLLLQQMFSAESLTSPHPGFPELFQTGETYHGQPLVDHQHPHNVFAELSALYTLPVSEKVTWLLYGGPSAEPALGPVTYMHRQSAAENPEAPLGHHLQDSTHTSFGVVTTGFILNLAKFALFKVEGSAFNAHEPNEERWSIQLAPLDSWSFRVSAAPTRNWTAQYSVGFLQHPEALDPNNELRQSASLEYNRPLSGGKLGNGNWASSLIWGRKHKELDNTTQNSYLFESTLNFLARNYAYTRLELVDKDELFPEDPTHPSYRIGAYTFGGVRDLVHSQHWQVGLGGDVTFYSKPAALDPIYGDNPVSFHVFVRIRPGLMEHGH
ncbi:MAG TPA: hypothetical protein VK788_01225 [Terriglobales bacterium]|nr:hypothetical protein [Terriglobales bacterium]